MPMRHNTIQTVMEAVMNEQQAEALRQRDMARGRVKVAQAELSSATIDLSAAERKLRALILRDPNSWRNTPGVKEGRYA